MIKHRVTGLMEMLLRWDVKKNMFSCNSLCAFVPQLVEFSRSVMSDSLRPHELQHARPPCPSKTPGVHSNSCPFSQWCRPIISSSIVCFSSCLQSLPVSESFPMSQLFTWGGQSTGVSALASFHPKKSQGCKSRIEESELTLPYYTLINLSSSTSPEHHVPN